ncbi:DUF3667 domain-containing protein [Chryseobacterium sp. FH1]|uniref:DUF3667 domain-containing protein n=1 Tax=Chryseobacterium sp. FH1 TaxID=1233951 RepID=UPI0009DD619D|nr:DUF3667 domain-containing protein [Chryseobacterium sp. FH1]
MQTCKNCGHRFEGKFCNNCGQTVETERIDFHYLKHEIPHSFFHVNAGLFYTSKQLFIRPGHAIREYLEGKRVNHSQPLSFILILAGFYILLCHLFHINLFELSANSSDKILSDDKTILLNEWMLEHYGWLTLATIPLYTAGTFLCFYNRGYNFVEYLILNTFKAGQRLIVQLAFLPFIFVLKHSMSIGTIMLFIYLVDLGLNFWTNIQFFNQMKMGNVIIRSILSHIIMLILMMLAVMLYYQF